MIESLRGLGLTLAEIRELSEIYLARTEDPIGPRLAAVLRAARARAQDRITGLQQLLGRIDDFEAGHAAELSGRADFRAQDPRTGQSRVDSPPRGRP